MKVYLRMQMFLVNSSPCLISQSSAQVYEHRAWHCEACVCEEKLYGLEA